MLTNQHGAPINETQLFSCPGEIWTTITEQDRNDAIALLCEYLGVEIWRTNATKHGGYELQLRKAP